MASGTRHISIFPVLLINFIGTLGFSIVIPFLVFLVTRWGGNAFVYGLLAATYPAFQFVGAPILGRWSDRIGRRRVLLVSQLGTFVSWLIFAGAMALPKDVLLDIRSTIIGTFTLTLPLLVLFVARALDGLTGGNISVANAYLTDITPEEERSKNFGKMAISSNLGFVLGPALAGLLGSTALGELLPVAAAAFVSLLATLLVAFYLPESNPCAYEEHRRCVGVRKILGQEQKNCFEAAEGAGWKEALRRPYVGYMLMLYFLIFLGFNFFYTAFPNHAVRGLEWTVGRVGIFFTILSGIMVFVQGPLLARLSSKYSPTILIVGGGVVLGTSFVVLTAGDTTLTYGAAVLFALGNGLMWPSYMSVLSKVGSEDSQGMIQGLGASVGSLASIMGLVVGGLLYNSLTAGTFALSAIIIYASALLSIRTSSVSSSG
ncbi:MAG: MFS transporter [Phycisphaerales bacterium]|nr:MFS transporter [Phycisphaerales bacterium]